VLERCKLKFVKRGLADRENRGALNLAEFTVAMHLIHGLMTKQITSLPETIPVEMFATAADTERRTFSVSSVGSGRIQSQVPPQVPPKIQQSPVVGQFTGTSLGSSDGWEISPADRAKFDKIFASVDTANKGFIGTHNIKYPLINRKRRRSSILFLIF
jgi:epidermal growth factor receptor substrate 15